MSFKVEILEALQDYGFVRGKTVVEHAGWRTRGSEIFNPKGSVNHHTAGPRVGDLPTLNTLLFGRSDLAGPLCNGALSRSAVIHLIAAGRANHAGSGGGSGPFIGLAGNSSVWGLEVEHCGYADEAVSEARWDAMFRWHAACCDVSGVMPSKVGQHFEWAPTRKIDFCKPLIGDPSTFRANVARSALGVDMDAAQDQRLKDVETVVRRLEQAMNPRASQNVMTSGPDVGKVVPTGTPGSEKVGDIWRWVLAMELERQGRETALQDRIAQKVVAALPPAAGGAGVTEAQVRAMCVEAINETLGFLKPGQ